MADKLAVLIDKARAVTMSPEAQEEQHKTQERARAQIRMAKKISGEES